MVSPVSEARFDTTRPLLSFVVDRNLSAQRALQLPAVVEACAAKGVDLIQLRERELGGDALLSWAREITKAAARGAARSGRSVACIVNRRLDIALAIEADGVHLGFDALGAADAASLLARAGDRSRPHWLGLSAHSPEDVRLAREAGANYAHLAPIYAPLSKEATRPELGLAGLRAACLHGLPVLAQGGVTPAHCADLLEAGAAGIAVTGALLQADDAGTATRAFRRALDAASAG